mgnify:CR=1 FL=1
MVTREQIDASKDIQRRTGRTFYVATRVLPEWMRRPTYVLYAFFRIADDVVDDPNPASPAEQRARLEHLRRAALGEDEADEPAVRAFAELKRRHGIPDEEVHTFIDAMEMDVADRRYETYADLETYLRGSAVAVAYMMLEAMEPDQKEAARPHAKALGEAFQLTNFLRDVREDVLEYDRIYLPRETLAKHGVTDDQIRALDFDEGFANAMREEMARTDALYREGVAGIKYLPEECQLAVLASATLYAEHHRAIRARGFDVLTERPTLTTPRRFRILAETWYHFKRTGDPETAFYRVAPVSPYSEDDMRVERGRSGVYSRVVGSTRAFADAVRSWVPTGWSW